MKDYYKTLELKFGATETEIKKSYRFLAQKYHPDKNFGNKKFEELFKELNEAYSFLNDASKKSNYDNQYRSHFSNHSSSNSEQSTESTNTNKKNTGEKGSSDNNEKGKNQKYDTVNKEDSNSLTKLYNKKFYRYSFFIVLVLLGFLIYKWNDISAYYNEKAKKEKYSNMIDSIQKPKRYKELKIDVLTIPRVILETRWKDDLMYYKFHLYSKSKEDIKQYKKLDSDSVINDSYFEIRLRSVEKFNIDFLDKDGFKIHTFSIPMNNLTKILNKYGSTIGYTINSNISLKPELYEEFHDWEVTYSNN